MPFIIVGKQTELLTTVFQVWERYQHCQPSWATCPLKGSAWLDWDPPCPRLPEGKFTIASQLCAATPSLCPPSSLQEISTLTTIMFYFWAYIWSKMHLTMKAIYNHPDFSFKWPSCWKDKRTCLGCSQDEYKSSEKFQEGAMMFKASHGFKNICPRPVVKREGIF